jgi:hypothetical protein
MCWLQVVLILPVDGSTSSTIYHFHGKYSYLKELLEACILYFFNIGCYNWIVSPKRRASIISTNFGLFGVNRKLISLIISKRDM